VRDALSDEHEEGSGLHAGSAEQQEGMRDYLMVSIAPDSPMLADTPD
jgi:hypothetical protein